MKYTFITLSLFVTLISLSNCSSKKETNSENKIVAESSPSNKIEKETPKTKSAIINIQDTVEVSQTVLCIKDSASTIEGMHKKLSTIYNSKLQETIKANKLTITGSPMAWQTILKTAYFFEAGIPVDRTPTKMGKGMYMKNTGADSAVVAHFWGPHDLTKSGYDAIEEKFAETHKIKSTTIYEIYKGDHFPTNNEAIDFYKLQTDIVAPYRKTIVKSKKMEIVPTKEQKIVRKKKKVVMPLPVTK